MDNMDYEGKTICAGIPRSGTTMLYRALAGLPPGSVTPRPQTGPIYKTHSFEPESFAGARGAIFMFGDPIASVLSTRSKRWTTGHFQNCGIEFPDLDGTDIFRHDALNYERMFDAWTRHQAFDVVCARYETIHEHAGQIAAVLGIDFKLPGWRPRANYLDQVSDVDLAAAKKTYERLSIKIDRAPDLAIRRARRGHPDQGRNQSRTEALR